MEAGISFTIYGDYYKHVVIDGWDVDYSKALQVLNDEVKELVDSGKLAFKYDNKKVTIKMPITFSNVGNIFFPEDYDGPCWESVDIWCEIEGVSEEDFDSKKLKVKKIPAKFAPQSIGW